MPSNQIIDLKKRLQSNDNDDLFDVLVDIGKGGHQELKTDVHAFLTHEDPMLRATAIKVLAFYWGLEEYKDVAKEMFVNDPDDETRADALIWWSCFFKDTNNPEVLKMLYDQLKSQDNAFMIRETAYRAVFNVSKLNRTERPANILKIRDIDNEVDWDLVEKIMKDAEKEAI